MSDVTSTESFKPADHILDEFLAKHDVTVGLPEFGALLASLREALSAEAHGLPEDLRGDGPCDNCGTHDNIVWFTDNVFWNAVVRVDPEAMDKILCIPCFIIEVDGRGLNPTGWHVTPEWPWRRRAAGEQS